MKEATCPICEQVPETVMHILWDFVSAKDVWGQSSIRIQKFTSQCSSFKALMEEIIGLFDQNLMDKFVVTTWKLWSRRNELIFKGKFSHPNQLVQ